jgi:hypothetical protein
MPVLIDTGDGNPVKVNIDGIEDMTPDQQAAAVQSVTATLHAQGHVNAGPQATQQPSQPPDTSWGGALHHGLAEAAQGLGSTISTVGQLAGSDTLQGAGKSVSGAVSEPAGYQPTDIPGALRQGDYMGALKQLPRAAAEYAPQLAGQLAGAAAGSAVAGPVGAAVGAGGATALENFGPNVQARAAANNDATPTTSDAVVGGLTTAAQSALAGVGIPVGRGLGAIGRPLTQIAADTGVGAGNEALREVGTTAGTNKGLSVDPAQIGAAGLQAAVSRAASVVPRAMGDGVGAATDQVMSRTVDQPVSEDHAASIVRAKKLMEDAQTSAEGTSGPVNETTAANNVKSQLYSNLKGTIDQLSDAGVLDGRSASDAMRIISERALRHNNTFTDNDAIELSAALEKAPEGIQKAVLQDARDLNTISTQSFRNNQQGPFQKAANIAGQLGAVGIAATHGNIPEVIAAAAGHSLVGKTAGRVGMVLDNVFGTNRPPVAWQQMAAQRMLSQNGLDAGTPMATAQVRQSIPAPSPVDPVQAKLDTAVKRNHQALMAASLVPAEQGDTAGVAQQAAIAQAHRNAARVMADAGALPAQAKDALAVGSPAAMTTPEGTPVNLDGTPLQAPQRPAWGRQRSPATTTPAAPQAPPTGSVEPPEATPAPQQPSTVPAYLANRVAGDHGIVLTPDVYHAAIDSATQAGHINDVQAKHLHENPHMGMNNDVATILSHHIGGGTSSGPQPATVVDPTVHRPVAYLAAAQAHHADMNRTAAELDAIGIPGAANLIRQVRDADNQTPDTDKTAILASGIEHFPPEVQALIRSKVTAKQLTHGKPKEPK